MRLSLALLLGTTLLAGLAAQDAFRPWGGAEYRHQEIRTALDAYFIDHNAYPPWRTYLYRGQQEVPTFASAVLTTPIAYLRGMPVDIFSYDERHWTAYYMVDHNGVRGWAIWSAGPDEDYDFPYLTAFDPASPENEIHVRRWDYHATNGVISDGDLITVSP